jgi:protein-disulfide isomerase
LSLEAALLARLNGKEDYIRIAHALFEKQESWTSAKDPLAALKKVVVDLGFSPQKVEEALSNKKTETQILSRCVDGIKQYKIDSTPTVIVGGEIIPYAADLKKLKASVDRELKKNETKKRTLKKKEIKKTDT